MRRFEVWSPDIGQSAVHGIKISAIDAQQAAEEWAEWHDAYSAELVKNHLTIEEAAETR